MNHSIKLAAACLLSLFCISVFAQANQTKVVVIPMGGDESAKWCGETCRDRVIFATSTKYTGDLVSAADLLYEGDAPFSDGLEAADALCQWHADQTSFPGTYKALLYTSTSAPGVGWDQTDSRPVILTTGALVERSLGHMYNDHYKTGQHIERLINVSEKLESASGFVWTGANDYCGNTLCNPNDGHVYTCRQWTSGSASDSGRFGYNSHDDKRWFFGFTIDCSIPNRLHCVQQ